MCTGWGLKKTKKARPDNLIIETYCKKSRQDKDIKSTWQLLPSLAHSLTHLRRECLPERPAEHDVDGGEVGDRAADGDHREAHALQNK